MLDTSRERAQPIGMASDGTFDRWRSDAPPPLSNRLSRLASDREREGLVEYQSGEADVLVPRRR
jgi:hypothetical protein